MDLILGDVSFNNLNLLLMGVIPKCKYGRYKSKFSKGNGSDISAEINSFPAAFLFDVNNDDIKT